MLGKIKSFWDYTQMYFVYSLLLAAIVFFVEFSAPILQILGDSAQAPNEYTQKTVSQYVISFLQWLSELPQANNVIVGLFWAGAAVLLYFLYITLSNMYIATRNEYIVDVNNSKKQNRSQLLVNRFGSKILIGLGYFIFAVVSIVYLIPYFMNLLHIYVYSGMRWTDFGYLIAGIVGLTGVFYLLSACAVVIWKYEQSV